MHRLSIKENNATLTPLLRQAPHYTPKISVHPLYNPMKTLWKL